MKRSCVFCGVPALYLCGCQEKPIFICNQHLPVHIGENKGAHPLQELENQAELYQSLYRFCAAKREEVIHECESCTDNLKNIEEALKKGSDQYKSCELSQTSVEVLMKSAKTVRAKSLRNSDNDEKCSF
jgi:hypothetical protein